MKEQYIGDVKDYFKYSLVEFLSKVYDKKVLFAWMLTPPDGTTQGNDVNYLNNPKKYAGYNPKLYKELQKMIFENRQKSLESIEKILENEDYFFFNDELPIDKEDRRKYFSKLDGLTINNKIGLVFFDPDNGIEVKSFPKGTRKSNKYIYWDEIENFWFKGRDMLIFQYIPSKMPMSHGEYVVKIFENCKSNLDIQDNNINIIKAGAALFIYLRHEPIYNILNKNVLKLKINMEQCILEFDELFNKLFDKENNIYKYYIDDTFQYNEYSLGTQPIFSLIESDLLEVESYDIDKIKLTKKEEKALDYCNLEKENLIGKYYDKHGNIYYCLNNKEIYRFDVQIKYLSMIYAKEQNKRFKLWSCSGNKVLKILNYGGDFGKWIIKDNTGILKEGIGVFFGEYINDHYGDMLYNCDENGNIIR